MGRNFRRVSGTGTGSIIGYGYGFDYTGGVVEMVDPHIPNADAV